MLPISRYEALYGTLESALPEEMIKILIDHKCGRWRQAFNRYQTILEKFNFDTKISLTEQTNLLNEETAQLVLFELMFCMTNVVSSIHVDKSHYIEVLDHFSPADRVMHGALYNLLLSLSIREGAHSAARQFASMALYEYRAAKAPYLEGFIYVHLALLDIAEARYDAAYDNNEKALSLFQSVQDTAVELAQVYIIKAWLDYENKNILPEREELDAAKKSMLEGAFWGETFLMLASVLLRSKIAMGLDSVLEVHAELETVLRVRRMTNLLPAMQLMRDEYFALGSPSRINAVPADLDEFHLLLLLPNVTTLCLNVANPNLVDFVLPRMRALSALERGQEALKNRQFPIAADHLWTALDLIDAHQMRGLLKAELATFETFLAECRARRRFVERARDVRNKLLIPLGKSETAAKHPHELTATEYAVLQLLPNATSNKGMARDLSVSEATIKFHLSNIYRKLGVNRRGAAIKAARARHWIGSYD